MSPPEPEGAPGAPPATAVGLAPVRVVAIGLAVSVCASLPMLLTGALAVQIRAELGFGATGIGAAVAGFFAAGALGSVVLGRVVERVGGRRGLQLSACLAATGLLGVAAFGRGLWLLLVFLAFGGLANAAAHPAANLVLMRGVRERRRGLVFGVKQSAIPVASLLGGLAVPAIALTVGWRWAFALAGAAAVALAATLPKDLARIAPSRRVSGAARASGVGAAGPPLVLVAVAAGLAALAANALAGFLTITYVDAGMSEAAAGWLLALSSAVGVGARVTIGWLADRFVRLRFAAVAVLMLAGAGSFGMLATGQAPVVIVGSLFAYAAGWGWPGLLNFSVSSSQAQAPAAATGIVQTGVYFGAAVGPLGFGLIADAASLTSAWWLMAVAAVLGGVLMLAGHAWLRQRTPNPGGGTHAA